MESPPETAPLPHRRGWSPTPLRLFRLLLALALLPSAFPQSCSNQQSFPSDEESWFWVTDLVPNVPTNNTLCPGHWVWFRVPTRFIVVGATELKRSGTSWNLQPTEQTAQQHALSIALDAGYDEVNNRFTSLSFIAVNGTPPTSILDSNPYSAADYAPVTHHYVPVTDRETLTLGFNDTVGGTCQQPLDPYVYMGIKCTHPPGASGPGPCTYNLTVSALPHTLQNGVTLDGYLRPVDEFGASGQEASRHYYRVPVAPYEALAVDIAREGDGRPLFARDGAPLSLGLAGAVFASRIGDACPANGSAALEQVCPIGLNDTAPCTIGHSCSSALDSTAELVLMIEATVGDDRPVTSVDAANSNYASGCEPAAACSYVLNMVDRYGLRPTRSSIPGAEDREPRYNDPASYQQVADWQNFVDNRNELRYDRGVYRLTVTKLAYAEGLLLPGESRPGCVSYGQWRHFHIVTTGAQDATLSVHATAESGRGLGGLYVRQGLAPTEQAYAALAERGSPASTPQRVTVSPCDLNVSTVWHVAVMLEDQATATSRGVPPTRFLLSVHLEDSLLGGGTSRSRVLPRGGDRAGSPAAGASGDGFVCCGAFKYFLVPRVPPHLYLKADLKVTKGEARAVYLKAKSCPAYPADVQSESCLGKCTVSWLTTFDPFDGAALSRSLASPHVPHGLGRGCPAACPPDLRAEGDWYVGVQALPGTEAEFELGVSMLVPPPVDPGHQCDPLEPECRGPVLLNAQLSAASRRVRARADYGWGGAGLLLAWGATTGAAAALLSRTLTSPLALSSS